MVLSRRKTELESTIRSLFQVDIHVLNHLSVLRIRLPPDQRAFVRPGTRRCGGQNDDHLAGDLRELLCFAVCFFDRRPDRVQILVVRQILGFFSTEDHQAGNCLADTDYDGFLDQWILLDGALNGQGKDFLTIDQGHAVIESGHVFPSIGDGWVWREDVAGVVRPWGVIRVGGGLGWMPLEINSFIEGIADGLHPGEW